MMRPIDMSIPMQQSTTVRPGQNGEGLRPEAMHQQFADKLNKELHQHVKQVNQTHKAEDVKINPDQKGKGGNSGQQRKNSGKRQGNGNRAVIERQSGSMLDITI